MVEPSDKGKAALGALVVAAFALILAAVAMLLVGIWEPSWQWAATSPIVAVAGVGLLFLAIAWVD